MTQEPKKITEPRISEIDKYVSNQLKNYRIIQGISQQALANAARVSIQQLQKYEKGTNRISSGKLYLFARFLKIPITYFFKEDSNDFNLDNIILSRDGLIVLKAYNAIKDPIAKTKILNLIKTIDIPE